MILDSACLNSRPTTISDVTACSICLHGIQAYRIAMAWIVPFVKLFKFANVISSFELLQHVLVVKYFGCNRYIREYRNRLIFNISRYFRFDFFVVNDITYVNGITRPTFVGKLKLKKRTFVYIIFLNNNKFETSVKGNFQDDCCKFLYIWMCDVVFQTWVLQGI